MSDMTKAAADELVRELSIKDPWQSISNSKADAYLYGYPSGRKHRFRSPADFFPHLFWMATDRTRDSDKCRCKLCVPDDLMEIWDEMERQEEQEKPSSEKKAKVELKPGANLTTNDQESATSNGAKMRTYPQVVINKTIHNPRPTIKAEQSRASITAPQRKQSSQSPPVPTYSPLPAVRCSEQQRDAECNVSFARPGELMWYIKPDNAFGLVVIVERKWHKDQRNQDHPQYIVQSLASPLQYPDLATVTDVTRLRPFLAYSLPKLELESIPGFRATLINFERFDWEGIHRGTYGDMNVEVQASLWAAKMVDRSYTLIQPLRIQNQTAGETSYNGLFLGSEKIWLGEAVRLNLHKTEFSTPETQIHPTIMILHSIRSKPTLDATKPHIQVLGDIYILRTGGNQSPPASTSNTTSSSNHPKTLPFRLTHDLENRNRIARNANKPMANYVPLLPSIALPLSSIRGRWYESLILSPILDSQRHQQNLQEGSVPEISNFNYRGQASIVEGTGGGGEPTIGDRRTTRREAYGASVPSAVNFGDELEVTVASLNSRPLTETSAVLDPALSATVPNPAVQQQAFQSSGQGVGGEDALSAFVDVERMDDGAGTGGY